MKVGQRIMLLRTLTGESQTALGKAINVMQRMIVRYEQGNKVPDYVADALCEHYKTNRLWLNHGSGNIFSESVVKFDMKVSMKNNIYARIRNKFISVINNEFVKILDNLYSVAFVNGSFAFIFETNDTQPPYKKYTTFISRTPFVNEVLDLLDDLGVHIKLKPYKVTSLVTFKDITLDSLFEDSRYLSREEVEAMRNYIKGRYKKVDKH